MGQSGLNGMAALGRSGGKWGNVGKSGESGAKWVKRSGCSGEKWGKVGKVVENIIFSAQRKGQASKPVRGVSHTGTHRSQGAADTINCMRGPQRPKTL